MSDLPAWTPRPDPALISPLRAGLHPHRHPPDLLHGWVFLQHQYGLTAGATSTRSR
jgi:hypothetical protein